MGRLSDALDRLRVFPEIVADLDRLTTEMACVAADAPHASLVKAWARSRGTDGHYRPIPLGPILAGSAVTLGMAVGWHAAAPFSLCTSDNGVHDGRLLAGQLVRAAKQYDLPQWSVYAEDVQRIGAVAACALALGAEGWEPGVIVAMPSSRGTNTLPWLIGRDLAFLTRSAIASPDVVRFTRPVAEIKEVRDYAVKREMLDGSMAADTGCVAGRDVLVVDDVCRSGATLRECAAACRRAGASSVAVLAVSKTWRFQRLPDAIRQPDLRREREMAAIEPYDAL